MQTEGRAWWGEAFALLVFEQIWSRLKGLQKMLSFFFLIKGKFPGYFSFHQVLHTSPGKLAAVPKSNSRAVEGD